jgi:hypothetical protein
MAESRLQGGDQTRRGRAAGTASPATRKGATGIELASREAAAFTREVVVPFINRNQTPAGIRHTLLSVRGRFASPQAERAVFAVDLLEKRRDWLEADFALFRERYQEPAPQKIAELTRDYRRTIECWDVAQ